MARRALRTCGEPGCPALVKDAANCPTHAAEAAQRYDKARGTASSRGYGDRHRAWRADVLRRDPVCVLCKQERATVADHIVPKKQGGAHFDLANGQGLCHACHNGKTARDGSRD